MKNEKRGVDIYLVLLLAIIALWIFYWVEYGVFVYRLFVSAFFDIGLETYSTYVHVFYPNVTPGLQYLSFATHISLFRILLLPVFAVFPNPITLITIQDVFLAMTSLVLYFCGKELMKSRGIGFALAVAFLFNPGVRGITMWDFHSEAFIPFFGLLAFYFYMKDRQGLFLLSYTFMLSVIEFTWVVGLSFVAGMLYYEFRYNSRLSGIAELQHRKRIGALFAAGLICIIFFLFYNLVIGSLLHLYSAGFYSSLPPMLRVINFSALQYSNLFGALGGTQFNLQTFAVGSFFGLVLLFIGFGIGSLADPILNGIFIAPWLYEVFVIRNLGFASFTATYYAYLLAWSAASAILGMRIMLDKKTFLYRGWRWLERTEKRNVIIFLSWLTLYTSILLYIGTFPNTIIPPFIQNNSLYPNYTRVEAVLNTIPANAKVMVQENLFPHMFRILNLELSPAYGDSYSVGLPGSSNKLYMQVYWFKPDYVVIYPNTYYYWIINSSNFSIYNYMGNNYTLLNSTGGMRIYRSNGFHGG